jgi:hypothetical protein
VGEDEEGELPLRLCVFAGDHPLSNLLTLCPPRLGDAVCKSCFSGKSEAQISLRAMRTSRENIFLSYFVSQRE